MGEGRVILIVEDNPANQALTLAVLRRAGFATRLAGSIREARAALEGDPPAAILMDLALPDGDGLGLTRELRASPRTARVPIIAVTAHAMAAERERARGAGCNGYITKPIDTRTFAAQIAAVLAGKEAT